MFCVSFFFIISIQCLSAAGFYTKWLKTGRQIRHCHGSSTPFPSLIIENSKAGTCMILITGLIFMFIFLGLLKGLVGLLCFDKIGMYGLSLLIDLPRPLHRYQEKKLQHRIVVYDIGGWPVHPDTLQRTVRILPKRTELCLNLIFFLAYPLAACVYVCAFFCCIRNLRPSVDNTCFKHVDVVRLTNAGLKNSKEKLNGGGKVDVYKEDYKEEQDTKYVMEAMEKSKDSIREYRVKIDQCDCNE